MTPIKILIADDDAGMRLVMRRLVEQAEGYALAGEASDGAELIRLYDEHRPEVVLLDVEMPELSGIECARAIQDRDPRTVLVFATAHEEYMASAFEVYAFDYLVKPFRVERAMETFRRIRERLRGGAVAPMHLPEDVEAPGGVPSAAPELDPAMPPVPGRMMLRHREGVSFVDVPDIAMVMRENRATVLLMKDGARYVVPDGMAELDERLPDEIFFRTHKSYIVNLNLIESIQPYGRWTFIVKLKGLREDALITHERFEALQKRFM
jgi:two-component system LytT family response regulator